MDNPYVISADAMRLMNRWGAEQGYKIPSIAYFDDISANLTTCIENGTDHSVEFISDGELSNGIHSLIRKIGGSIVSLDRAYIEDNDPDICGFIDCTRAVQETIDGNGNVIHTSIHGLIPRPKCPPIDEQITKIARVCSGPITLVDDVIFTGEGMLDITNRLKVLDRPVTRVIAGIAIESAVTQLGEAGIEVLAVRTYKSVADEVCERDFLAGVPMSGRTVIAPNGDHWSAPYFTPFGSPEVWASIPPRFVKTFSSMCIDQSIDLWGEVEKASKRKVSADHLPRPLKGYTGDVSVVSMLKDHRDKINLVG